MLAKVAFGWLGEHVRYYPLLRIARDSTVQPLDRSSARRKATAEQIENGGARWRGNTFVNCRVIGEFEFERLTE
jgi:hypothetical protein